MLRRILILLLAWGALIAALSFLDPLLWRLLTIIDIEKFKATDFHHLFRQFGNLGVWALIALAIGLYLWKKNRASPRTAILIFASPLLSGALAELLKRLIGRERPGTHDAFGAYTFKPFLHAFTDSSNLGLPSSHAAVAFGGAFIVLRLFPGAGYIALLWAIGCGITRIALGAHYVTDVLAGAALGHLAATLLSPFLAPPQPNPPPHAPA